MSSAPSKYDLAVAYRIYPKVAKAAAGLPFSEDKYCFADACLRSFRQSLGNLRAKMWVLLDGCPPEYGALFRQYFDATDLELISLAGVGNLQTFSKQIEILLEQQDAEIVYFAEDDYFYLPGQFHLMIDFLRSSSDVDFVSPYDHLDCYTLKLHHHRKWLRVFADRHWRTAASTCLTFLTTQRTLRETQGIFRSYSRSNFDASLWLSLTKHSLFNPLLFLHYATKHSWLGKIVVKAWLYNWSQILLGRRRKLWVPVPAIATHMNVQALSPAIDWPMLMRQQAASVPESYWGVTS